MAIGCQLQALLLRPGLDPPQAPFQPGTPHPGAEVGPGLADHLVEQPHVDEVEQLREHLYR